MGATGSSDTGMGDWPLLGVKGNGAMLSGASVEEMASRVLQFDR